MGLFHIHFVHQPICFGLDCLCGEQAQIWSSIIRMLVIKLCLRYVLFMRQTIKEDKSNYCQFSEAGLRGGPGATIQNNICNTVEM